MVTDLPDYSKKVIVVYEGTITGGEVLVDHRKILGIALKTPTVAQCLPISIEHIVQINHEQIFGVALKTPTEAQCLPSSIENIVRIDHQQIKGLTLKDPTVELAVPISWEGPYLAYEPCIDAWKVKIVEWAVGTLPVSLAYDWARQLGLVDLSRVLGAALSHSNPVITRLTNGSAFIDPATETTLAQILAYFGAAGLINVALDTRASESTVAQIFSLIAALTETDYVLDLIKAKTDNLDVALSTRFKPTDSIGNTSFDATQSTRTSLKVQPEREDVLAKSFDLTVGTTSLLTAVGSQYHKVYGWDWEADTDGANEFSATISGVACKFARRTTKGVHAMTLIHPIICDVNTALSFISAGNTKLSLRYKTEA